MSIKLTLNIHFLAISGVFRVVSFGTKRVLAVAALLTCGFHALPASAQSGPSDQASIALAAADAAYARKDYAAAARQFAMACDAGSAEACGALGEMYAAGQGVTANGKIAAPLLAKACDAGLAKACGALGELYDRGNGVAINKKLAFVLFNKACTRADNLSCYNLGRLYESGQGTLSDVAGAARLYQQACTAGVADGCSRIGDMHYSGIYFPKDEGSAKRWYQIACGKGYNRGCEQVKLVEAEEARRRVAAQQERQAAAERRRLANSVPKPQDKSILERCLENFMDRRKKCISPGGCDSLVGQYVDDNRALVRNVCDFKIKVTAIGGIFGQPTDFIMWPGDTRESFIGISGISRWDK